MLDITSGKKTRAVKVVITGSEGIGKSTLASKAPGALFVDTEGGSDQLDVRRVNGIRSWTDLTSLPSEILQDPSVCGTLVLDTADWAEGMCISHICGKYKVAGIESFGYGKGYTYLSEEFSAFLKDLNRLIAAGINVIIIAHARLRKQELPDEQGAFDRWELKLSKQVAPLVKEWADAVLFCNYKTTVITTDKSTHKATGGQRVMYTSHHPCWDAKNRFGLAEVLPLSFDSISSIFPPAAQAASPASDTPKSAQELLSGFLSEGRVNEAELRQIVAKKGRYGADVSVSEYDDEFITGWILPNGDRIAALVAAGRQEVRKNV